MLSQLQRCFLSIGLENLILANEGRRNLMLAHVRSREAELEYYSDGPEYINHRTLRTRKDATLPELEIFMRGCYARRSGRRLVRRGYLVEVTKKPFVGFDLSPKGLELAVRLRRETMLENRKKEWDDWRSGARLDRPCGAIRLDVRVVQLGDSLA